MDFLVSTARGELRRGCSRGTGLGPMLTAARAWDAVGRRAAVGGDLVRVGGFRRDEWALAGSVGCGDAGGGRSVCGLADRGTSRAEQSATQIRASAAAFEAAFAATVHPAVVAANRAQLVSLVRVEPARAERSGHRGDRGRLRADVGPGRRRDGGLPRGGLGGRGPTDAVATGGANRVGPGSGLIGRSYTGTRITVAPAYIFENQPLIAPLLNLPSYSVLSLGSR